MCLSTKEKHSQECIISSFHLRFLLVASIVYWMVSADKLSEEQQLKTAKLLFYAGWACLPCLWLYNVFYFFPVIWGSSSPANRHAHPSEDVAVSAEHVVLRKFIVYSLIGGILSTVPLVSWYAVYVTQRNSWGTLGDALSLVIPKGS
jgi:presenilin enhancer 2